MKMRKINVLAIAPYEGLRELMESVAATRDDLSLTVHIGDLSDGADLAKRIQDQGFDIIISRGGTAKMIETIAHVPVVEVSLSGYDMLRVIRLARAFSGRYAIVGFPAIAESARLICELVEDKIDIFTINSQSEAQACLRQLSERGYGLIVGDTVTAHQSKQLGLNSVLVTSGIESVENAFDQAVKVFRLLSKRDEERQFLHALLKEGDQDVAVFSAEETLVYQSHDIPFIQEMVAFLQKHVQAVLDSDDLSIIRKADGMLYTIRGKRIVTPNASYAAFFCHASLLPTQEDLWITTRNAVEDYATSFNALYSENPAMRALIDQATAFCQSTSPVLIRGELGTGKDAIIHAIHSESVLRSNTLLTIDASRGSPKRWDVLLKHSDSPLCQMNLGIYFKNAQLIPKDTVLKLMDYLQNAQVHRRNRLFFSWQTHRDVSDADDMFILFLLDQLGCLTLSIPPLRNRTEDIASLSSIYINKYNLKFGKQIVGFDEEAMALLQSFGWDQNFYQLHQLVLEAVLLTSTARIAAHTVEPLLEKLNMDTRPQPLSTLDFEKSLDELTNDIIRIVLCQENNNHSRAAQRLGISRGTLWRKLKNRSDSTIEQ